MTVTWPYLLVHLSVLFILYLSLLYYVSLNVVPVLGSQFYVYLPCAFYGLLKFI